MTVMKVMVFLTLLFFISCQTKKEISSTIRFYRNIKLPEYELVGETVGFDTNNNFIKAFYVHNKLVKFYIHYNSYVIVDTVVYRKGEPFYCERYVPVYSKRDLKLYIVRRRVGKVLVSYWLNIVGHISPFVAIDSMYENADFSRHFAGEYQVRDPYNFPNELDEKKLDISPDHEYYEFSSIQDTANVLIRLVSNSPKGINGIRGGVRKSTVKADSGYIGMLQFLYLTHSIDPFDGIYYNR